MSLPGLTAPFPTHRLLTEAERREQLRQNERLNGQPRPHLTVIRMNSRYLECVDIGFGGRGLGTLVALGLLSLGIPLALFLPVLWLQGFGVVASTEDRHALLLTALVVTAFALPMNWVLLGLLRRDAFSYTHHPMRFDRQARLVHVFRSDGTALTVPWDELFVTLGYERSEYSTYGEVRAHVLADDRATVVESFGLSHRTSRSRTDPVLRRGDPIYSDSIYAQWEFLRRYMEEGPHTVIDQVKQCLSVDRDRESTAFSFKFLADRYSGGHTILRAVLSPFWTVAALFRIMAMRTSRVPRWPAHVEAGCVTEDGDPFAIEGTRDGHLVVQYPDAVRVAPPGAERLTVVSETPPVHQRGAPSEQGTPGQWTGSHRPRGRSSNQKGKRNRGA